jgi:tetratricopeptide (TPR) repeat protein
MFDLEPPDIHYFNAATGWLMLGDVAEARSEFNEIRFAMRSHPQVLDFEWRLLARERRWLAAVEVGERLLSLNPSDASAWIHRSFALHELQRTQEAFDLLLPAVQRFPEEITISYNLACYSSQLGDLPGARRWFIRVLTLDKHPAERLHRLQAALEDTDLQPLWPELRQQFEELQTELNS